MSIVGCTLHSVSINDYELDVMSISSCVNSYSMNVPSCKRKQGRYIVQRTRVVMQVGNQCNATSLLRCI